MKRLFLFFAAMFTVASVAMGQIEDLLSDDDKAYHNTLMGRMYYYDGDYAEAFPLFEKAAEQGNAEAQYSLGRCYYNGEGVGKDFTKGVYWYGKAAEQGHAEAQYNLGKCYYYGEGVNKDHAKAVYWFDKAAEQGDVEAQYNLGNCYYNGEGVSEDRQKATDLFYEAARHGYVLAQYNVGIICYIHSVEEETLFWFKKAADQNYGPAQFMLGRIYYEGSLIDHDYEKSVYYLLLAKESLETYISGSACNLLSKCYRNGRGVAQDIRKADELMAEAKEKGCGGNIDELMEKLKKEYSVIK